MSQKLQLASSRTLSASGIACGYICLTDRSHMAEKLPHLESILRGKLIEVADYQRPYAWETKQCRDLWDDIDLAGQGDHYTGTLVLQRTEAEPVRTDDGEALDIFEVVDGQQRLTTGIILLDRIRRRLETVEGEPAALAAAAKLTDLLWTTVDGIARPRLRVPEHARDVFEQEVLGNVPHHGSITVGEQRLIAAARFFDERIAELGSDDSRTTAKRLLDLRARVAFQLRFLVYDVQHSAEVGVLFETLNERGQPLSELEKVKNYLLYLSRQVHGEAGKTLVDRINVGWAEIFENLARTRIDEDALLRGHWLATQSPNPREWQRTASVKAKFPRSRYVPDSGRLAGGDHIEELTGALRDALVGEILTYVDGLRRCSAFLRDIYDNRATYDQFGAELDRQRARRATAALVRSGSVAAFRPLLLAARLKYPTDGALYAELAELCETFSARVYAISAARSTAGVPSLARSAFELFQGREPALIKADILARIWQFAPDESIRDSFRPHVQWYWRRAHKYILYEYELALSRDALDRLPFAESVVGSKTTEHVLPQTPDAGSDWWKFFTREQHEQLLHSIGNLVLTYDNSAYSNREYADKRGDVTLASRACYATSTLHRERELASRFSIWTPEVVEQRSAEVAEWALQRWPASAPKATPSPEMDEDDELDGAGPEAASLLPEQAD